MNKTELDKEWQEQQRIEAEQEVADFCAEIGLHILTCDQCHKHYDAVFVFNYNVNNNGNALCDDYIVCPGCRKPISNNQVE